MGSERREWNRGQNEWAPIKPGLEVLSWDFGLNVAQSGELVEVWRLTGTICLRFPKCLAAVWITGSGMPTSNETNLPEN